MHSKEGWRGYLELGIQNLMAQGRSTKVISMIKWIRTSRLSMNSFLSLGGADHDAVGGLEAAELEQQLCEPAARNQHGVRRRGP